MALEGANGGEGIGRGEAELPRVDAYEFAMKLSELDGGASWHLLVSDNPRADAHDVHAALSAVSLRAEVIEFEALLERGASCADLVAIVPLESIPDRVGLLLDPSRSMLLEHAPQLVVVVDREGLKSLLRRAPNAMSFFQEDLGFWELTPMSSERREAILEEMRRIHGWSDAEMISGVNAKHISLTPDIQVWLVLLGRGDLVGLGGAQEVDREG